MLAELKPEDCALFPSFTHLSCMPMMSQALGTQMQGGQTSALLGLTVSLGTQKTS